MTVGHQPVRREGSAPEGVTFPRIVGTAHLTMAAMATLPIMNAQRGTWDSGKERDRGPPALEKETVAFQPEIERERDRGPPARERQRGTVRRRRRLARRNARAAATAGGGKRAIIRCLGRLPPLRRRRVGGLVSSATSATSSPPPPPPPPLMAAVPSRSRGRVKPVDAACSPPRGSAPLRRGRERERERPWPSSQRERGRGHRTSSPNVADCNGRAHKHTSIWLHSEQLYSH